MPPQGCLIKGTLPRPDYKVYLLPGQPGYDAAEIDTQKGERWFCTIDEARAEIADKLAAQKQRGQMVQYLEHLREQAIIDWKNDEVKKAYRRLMNQHHPDKLVARGLPQSMIGIAEQKTYEVRAA